MNFFGAVRQKNSTENSDNPFLCLKFLEPEFFRSNEVFPNETLRYWNKKFGTKSFAYNIEISGGIHVCRKHSKTRF